MIRSACAVVIWMICTLPVKGQPNDPKGYLSFNAGPSFPVSGYGKKEVTDNNSGLARLGGSAVFSYSRLTGKKFGISFLLSGQLNPLDTKAIEKGFSQLKFNNMIYAWSGNIDQPLPPAPATGNRYPNWSFENKSWVMASISAGGYAEFPLPGNDGISFTVKVMAGVTWAKLPLLNGISITDTATAYVQQTSNSGIGINSLTSAGIKIPVSKKIYFLGAVDYFSTGNIKFKDIKATVTTTKGTVGSPGYTISQSQVTGDVTQKINSVNVLAGIGIRL